MHSVACVAPELHLTAVLLAAPCAGRAAPCTPVPGNPGPAADGGPSHSVPAYPGVHHAPASGRQGPPRPGCTAHPAHRLCGGAGMVAPSASCKAPPPSCHPVPGLRLPDGKPHHGLQPCAHGHHTAASRGAWSPSESQSESKRQGGCGGRCSGCCYRPNCCRHGRHHPPAWRVPDRGIQPHPYRHHPAAGLRSRKAGTAAPELRAAVGRASAKAGTPRVDAGSTRDPHFLLPPHACCHRAVASHCAWKAGTTAHQVCATTIGRPRTATAVVPRVADGANTHDPHHLLPRCSDPAPSRGARAAGAQGRRHRCLLVHGP